MPAPDPTDLIRLLAGESVFDRDTDSKILQAANEVSGRALVELFMRFDVSVPNWASEFADGLMEISSGDPFALIGFDDGRSQGLESEDNEIPEIPENPPEYYLRLEFTGTEACFYQFHLFPSFDEPFIHEVSRKRAGESQFVRISITHRSDLQVFIQNLRGNPHLVAVHDSTADEFRQAPSHGM